MGVRPLSMATWPSGHGLRLGGSGDQMGGRAACWAPGGVGFWDHGMGVAESDPACFPGSIAVSGDVAGRIW